MAFVHIKAHARQLLPQLAGTALAGVGQKQEGLILCIQPIHKLLDAGQDAVAMVDNTIHITNIALFITQNL